MRNRADVCRKKWEGKEMFKANPDYQRLQGSYLFSTIAKKVAAYTEANKDADIIRLGIGDVTQPLAPQIISELHKAVDEMADASTFQGYAPDLGYEFLRNAIAEEYRQRGCNIADDEIFVSDGAKSDSGNIQEIFAADSKVAICDPVYPVYVDSNVMAGRSGNWNPDLQRYENFIYMPCTEENNFTPEFPKENPDLIYLCYPNNPTGMTISKDKLQEWVDYANRIGAVILYDAAYEAYISEPDVPHSIFECEGAHCSSERTQRCRRNLPSQPLGQKTRHKVQRRSLHHSESRRCRIHAGRTEADP